jgi:hypothetical protein
MHSNLQCQLISGNIAQFVRIERNEPGLKAYRVAYANWLMANQNLDFLYADDLRLQITTQ